VGLVHGIFAISERDFRQARSYRSALLLEFCVGIFGLAIYYFVARTFTGAPTASLGSAPNYFAFAAVGIALLVVLQGTSVGVTRRVREEQLTGTLEMLLIQPVRPVQLAFGFAGYPFVVSIFTATAYLLFADFALGTDFSEANWAELGVSLVVSGVASITLGVLIACAVLVIKRAEAMATFALTGLALLGGAYFPIAVLPEALQPLAKVTPTRYAFDSVRAALYQGGDWLGSILALTLFTVITLPIALVLFSRALDVAKRQGTLNQF
jgi:ABC-2 type transport system permease protein